MSGFLKNGTDLDNIFEPRGTSTARAGTTGFQINGGDIMSRYYNLALGGSKAGDVGFKTNGTDISNYFAAKGTVSYEATWSGAISTPLGTIYGSGPNLVSSLGGSIYYNKSTNIFTGWCRMTSEGSDVGPVSPWSPAYITGDNNWLLGKGGGTCAGDDASGALTYSGSSFTGGSLSFIQHYGWIQFTITASGSSLVGTSNCSGTITLYR